MAEPATESLVERDAELSALTAAAERGAAGDGQLVVIEGLAGIGKTRLLQHVRSAFADVAGARALSARGTELETHVAFGVVRQLLEPLVFELTEDEREELFTGAASLARAVLTVGTAVDEPSEADRYSQINGLFWLASTLARERPLALVVDDVQWADEPSIEFLGFVARRIEGLPVLLAVATRPVKESPGHLAATLVTDPGATVLRPAPLSGGSVTALVRHAVGAGAEDDFASACLEATHGNPFLLSELLREVRAERLPPTAETARRVGSLAPGGVSAVVELRLAQMPDGARPLAEAVAILGDGTSAAAAAQLAQIEPSASVAPEEALVRSGILEDREGLAFAHPVVRTTGCTGSRRAAARACTPRRRRCCASARPSPRSSPLTCCTSSRPRTRRPLPASAAQPRTRSG
ncbi:MAG TPA: AAA family ATPase [Thermoleophilaceae bacterium]|nr:AAA family ATPase [Thermoleophilaceae bacterium]